MNSVAELKVLILRQQELAVKLARTDHMQRARAARGKSSLKAVPRTCTTYRPLSGGAVMLRMSAIAALLLLGPPAFAQTTEPIKDVKFGAGCLGPVRTLGPRFGTCEVDGSRTRIWCPNGQIFDRAGVPQSYIIRSICNLNQVSD